MSNEIDLLMDLDPTEMSTRDINDIIQYIREQRANFEKGIKPRKFESKSKNGKIDLAKLGLTAPAEPQAPAAPMSRRSW